MNQFSIWNGNLRELWSGEQIFHIKYDQLQNKIIFLGKSSNRTSSSLFIYHVCRDSTAKVISDVSFSCPKGYELYRFNGLSVDETKLFLEVRKIQIERNSTTSSRVNVWSYKDIKLQSQQQAESKGHVPSYLAVINFDSAFSIMLLQRENERVNRWHSYKTDDYVLYTEQQGEESEDYWNKEARGISWLAETDNGERRNP